MLGKIMEYMFGGFLIVFTGIFDDCAHCSYCLADY